MYKITLKPNWKDILKEKTVIIEVQGGVVNDYVAPEDVNICIIEHDNIEEDLPQILFDMGYEMAHAMADYIYDDIIKLMKDHGKDDLRTIVELYISTWTDLEKFKNMMDDDQHSGFED